MLFGVADQATHPLPLRLLYDCLGITQHATDPRNAEFLRVARAEWPDALLSNAVHAAVPDMLVTLIEEDCTSAPTMMVLDDVQWADDMSLDVSAAPGINRRAPTAVVGPVLPTGSPWMGDATTARRSTRPHHGNDLAGATWSGRYL